MCLSVRFVNKKYMIFMLHMLDLEAYNGFYRDCPVVQQNEVDGFAFATSELARKLMQTGLEGVGDYSNRRDVIIQSNDALNHMRRLGYCIWMFINR